MKVEDNAAFEEGRKYDNEGDVWSNTERMKGKCEELRPS